jgi:hypothetical protein
MLDFLLRPFSYLHIDHDVKKHVDWTLPIVLAFISSLALWGLAQWGDMVIYGGNGVIAKVLGFVQNLPGFYIAALAAIATFNRPDIDMHIPEPTPVMDIKIHGRNVAIKLTRRRFLCAMFAFLTAESILITGAAIMGLSIADPVKSRVSMSIWPLMKYTYFFVFMVLVWQMLVATFWGLYYLGEKLHQPDQVGST